MKIYNNLLISNDIINNIKQSLANKQLIENNVELVNCHTCNFKEIIKYKNIIFNISFNLIDTNNNIIIGQVDDNFNCQYILCLKLSTEIDIYNQLIDYILQIIEDAK